MRTLSIIILFVLGMNSVQAQRKIEPLRDEIRVSVAIGRSQSAAQAEQTAMDASWITGKKRIYDSYVGYVCETGNMGTFVILAESGDDDIKLSIFPTGSTVGKSARMVTISSPDSGSNNIDQFKLLFETDYYYYAIILNVPK